MAGVEPEGRLSLRSIRQQEGRLSLRSIRRGKVVVVTGAGGGLGRAHALLFARHGARVVVNDLGGARDGTGADARAADRVVAEITEAGGEAVADHASVADPDGAGSIVATALDAFGRIDVVVNNAGILRDVTVAKMTDEQWEAVRRVHLDGTYHVTRAAWPHLRAQSSGRVIVTSSTSGVYGNFGQANYGAAKMGVVGLVHVLALEGRKYGITANVIVPLAATRMTQDVFSTEQLARYDPAYVSPAVVHLASDACTDTGMMVLAGGGHYARLAIVEARGARFDHVPDPAELAARWSEVTDLTGAAPGGELQIGPGRENPRGGPPAS